MRRIASIDELQAVDFAKRNISPYISPIMDSFTLALVTKDLGITGRVEARIINGRQYIVYGGYAGKRSLFTGTIYSTRNAKIVQMAIGSLGIRKMVMKGARITIYATVPLTIIECIINDQFTLANIVGRVTADLVKVGIGSMVGGLAGLALSSVVTFAAFPILVTVAVGVFTGYLAQSIDDHYGLTDKLVAALEQSLQSIAEKKEELEKEMGRKIYEAERELIYRSCGFDIQRLTGLKH
jgi:hypothetical protein